jgi:hypothetical protein
MSEEEQPKSSDGNAEAPSSEAVVDVDAGASEAKPAEPRRKKKTRSKKARPLRSELDAAGRERPAFVLDFPEDPELEPLVAAFEAGNYAHVREHAPRLAASTERPEVKAAALELGRRIEPDPLVKFLLAVAIALFVVVVAYVYHSHGN